MSILDDKKIKNVEEFFSTQLERTNYWLSFAEAKNAGLLAINIAIIGAGRVGAESGDGESCGSSLSVGV